MLRLSERNYQTDETRPRAISRHNQVRRGDVLDVCFHCEKPMKSDVVLRVVLDELRRKQSHCPVCGGETYHFKVYDHSVDCDVDCALDGLWFEQERPDDSESQCNEDLCH